MESFIKSFNNNLVEKITGIEYFLIILGLFIYSDLFSFYIFNKSILNVTLIDLKSNTSISIVFQFLIYLTLLFAIISEVVLYLFEVYILKSKISFEMEDLKNDAIKKNISSAYSHYQYKLSQISKYKTIKKIILINLILVILDIITSQMFEKIMIISYLIEPFFKNDFIGFLSIILIVTPLIAMLFLSFHLPVNEIDASADIKDYEEINQKTWIDEITLGLIDKETMFNYLKVLKELEKYRLTEIPRDSEKNESAYRYCLHFDLVKRAPDNKFKFTEKGDFFCHYIMDIEPLKTITANTKPVIK